MESSHQRATMAFDHRGSPSASFCFAPRREAGETRANKTAQEREMRIQRGGIVENTDVTVNAEASRYAYNARRMGEALWSVAWASRGTADLARR